MKLLLLTLAFALTMGLSAQTLQTLQTQPQCQGKTAKKEACSRKAAEGSSYCWQHDPKANRCGALLKDGKSYCSRVTKSGRCFQHQ